MYLPAKVLQMGGIKNKTRFYFLFRVRVCMAGRVVPMGFYGVECGSSVRVAVHGWRLGVVCVGGQKV